MPVETRPSVWVLPYYEMRLQGKPRAVWCLWVIMLHALFCTGGQKYIMFSFLIAVECIVSHANALLCVYQWCFSSAATFFFKRCTTRGQRDRDDLKLCSHSWKKMKKRKEASAVLTKVPVVLWNCLMAWLFRSTKDIYTYIYTYYSCTCACCCFFQQFASCQNKTRRGWAYCLWLQCSLHGPIKKKERGDLHYFRMCQHYLW